MESILANCYKTQDEPPKLTKSEIDNEIAYLEQQIHANIDVNLYIIEHLAKITNDHRFITVALQHIKLPLKYAIYNLRLLTSLQETSACYIPLGNHIINIMKDIKIENDEKMYFDMNRLKVGNDAIHSKKFCEFVFEECTKLLYKNVTTISNSIGFPEVIYWIEKELKKMSFEGFCNKIVSDVINKLEKHKKYVIEERRKVKPSIYDVKDVKKIEKGINKLA
ncbi:Nucleolar complex protein 2 [Binucleata daphniae]